jgi:hypothetical protein
MDSQIIPDNEVRLDQPNLIPDNEVQPDIPDSQVEIQGQPMASSEDQYNTGGQQAIAGIEGAAQGVAGPLATLAETKLLGVNPKDIAGRERANPWTHRAGEAAGLIGSSLVGVGELSAISKGAEIAANASKLGKFGSMALKGSLEAAALQGSDEASHYLTGYDPTQTTASALANMGYAGIMGGATGGVFGLGDITASKGLKALENSKLTQRAENVMAGYGTAAKGIALTEAELRQVPPEIRWGYKYGQNAAENIANVATNNIGHQTVGLAGATIGFKVGGVPGSILGREMAMKTFDPLLDKILKKPLTTAAKKYVVPAMTRVLTSGSVKSLPSAIEYGLKAAKGAKMIDKAMDSVFIPGMQQTFNAAVDPQAKTRIEQNIDDEVLDQQFQQRDTNPGYAQGGDVHATGENHFAEAFPTESTLLQASKARVYQHLKTLKPNKEQEKTYNQALDLATNPLHIFEHVKNGSMTSGHVIHMNQMWPDLNDHLKKKIAGRIADLGADGKKPPYHIRQGLAIMLGAPLESAMTPQSILAAQQSFIKPSAQNSQNPTSTKNKRGTSSLQKESQPYKTPNQAGEADQAVRK